MSGRLKGIVIFVVVVAAVLGYKYYNQSQASSEVKNGILSWLSEQPAYAANKAYIDSILEEAHESAFDATYSMGSKRRGATFEDDKYIDMTFSHMKARAEKDQKPEIALAIDASWQACKAKNRQPPADEKK